MIRRFLIGVESWIFDDDSTFLGFGKLMLVITIVVVLLVLPFAVYDSLQPSFTLQKVDWSCVRSHLEWHTVLVGKVPVQRQEEVCDSYERK